MILFTKILQNDLLYVLLITCWVECANEVAKCQGKKVHFQLLSTGISMTIDLHVHSHYSDGTKSPAELVWLASKSGVRALAITDHDTMEGVPEAMAASDEYGVEVIPGVEISVVHDKQALHILGYYPDPSQTDLAAALLKLQHSREQRNEKIIAKLQGLGVETSLAELQEISGLGQTGRPHIAKLLIRHGVVRSLPEAFDRYLAKGQLAYEGRFTYGAKEAIELICGAGGLAVLAHPVQIDQSLTLLKTLLPVLVSYGLTGIETYYPSQKKAIQKRIKKFAQEYGLFLTGGSDYHGDIRPGTRLAGGHNVYVPPQLLDSMKKRLAKIPSGCSSSC